MSLLDDARRLAERGFTPWPLEVLGDGDDGRICESCNQVVTATDTDNQWTGHATDCPWLAMSQIVAALEAAERWLAAESAVTKFQARADMPDYIPSPLYHERAEARTALAAALKGEEVTTP